MRLHDVHDGTGRRGPCQTTGSNKPVARQVGRSSGRVEDTAIRVTQFAQVPPTRARSWGAMQLRCHHILGRAEGRGVDTAMGPRAGMVKAYSAAASMVRPASWAKDRIR